MPNLLLNSFNAGELSPYMDALINIEKYRSGCRTLENFIVLPYGGIYRRPGTEYLGQAKYADRRCRMIGFNFSANTRFVLEFGHEYIRVWGNGIPVLSVGSPLEIATPYQEEELQEVQYIQINDLMYFTHANHPPYKLTRKADDDWTLAPVAWKFPPLMDENTEDTTIEPSAATGTITLESSEDIFDQSHIGSQWGLDWKRDTASIEETISANKIGSSVLDIKGEWSVTTVGTWIATVKILRIPTKEMNKDGGSGFTDYEVVREFKSSGTARNFTATGEEETRAGLKIQIADYTSNTNAKVFLESTVFRAGGTVTITGVTDAKHATATADNWLGADISATKKWREAAFSGKSGYPRAVCLHEQRLCFAGTKSKPNTIWCSKSDDFENFETGSNDDDALIFTLASVEGNRIAWMYSQSRLMVGTDGDEWTIGTGDSGKPFTATNVQAEKQTSYGSKTMRSIHLNDVLLFVQRRGRKVRELTYSFERDSWVAPDLTILSEQITRGQLVEVAFQQQPDAILWAVRGDGQLIGMTYERDQNVVAWHRHSTRGAFESVTTVYGPIDGDDEVWFSVQRKINGQTVRYIERFRPDAHEEQEKQRNAGWWYLDAAARYNGSPTKTMTGLGHLEGEAVDVLADGVAVEGGTVAGGQLTIDRTSKVILAGIPFVSVVEPMPLDFALQDGGSTHGKKKRIHAVTVCLYKSLAGQFSTNEGREWLWIYPRGFTDKMDVAAGSFSGDKDIVLGGDFDTQSHLSMRQSQPFPMTIRAIVAKMNAYAG